MSRNSILACVLPAVLGLGLFIVVAGVILALAVTPEGEDPINGVGLWFYLEGREDDLNTPLDSNDADDIIFEVREGENANDVGVNLVIAGLVNDGTLFARYARYHNLDDDIKPGMFLLRRSMTIPDILAVITNPKPTTVQFLVRENMRLEEIADLIDVTPLIRFTGQDFLALVGTGAQIPEDFRQRYGIPVGASLEGFLYPATYELSVGTTAVELRDKMLTAFDGAIPDEMLAAAIRQGRTFYEVVTVASIVEREAVHADERPAIAEVYLNRLVIGMPLDADPTVQYQKASNEYPQNGNWWPQITQADYRGVGGAYNTYINSGLPPGPIVSPSVSSIRAVIYPKISNPPPLFFRANCNGDGYHNFSVTYEEHVSKGC